MLVSHLQPLFLNNAKITHDDSIKFSREFMSIAVSYSRHFAKYRHNAEKQEDKFVHNMCTDKESRMQIRKEVDAGRCQPREIDFETLEIINKMRQI